MKKNYVLDANVLLHDPESIFKFEDNNVVIPIYALEEVDQFKRESTERGRSARSIARLLDELRALNGTLSAPMAMDGGGTLHIALPKKRHEPLMVGLESGSMDHAILMTAIEIRDRDREVPTIFVTMDTNLRVRADALGVQSETYESTRVRDFDLERSVTDLVVPRVDVETFLREGSLAIENERCYANAGLLLRDAETQSLTALGRYDGPNKRLRALRVPREGVMGIRPKNKEQAVALDLLLDESVRLVALLGKAGTGKTLIAIAAGLHRVTVEHAYTRLLVSRPVMPHGRDIGFLPGSVDDKLNPWMQPVFDNLEFIFTNLGRSSREKRTYEPLVESGMIQIEPLTYIRGRSLPRQYLIVDEAQNLTPHEVKTIITRAGDGTKIVLTGDPHQIDHPYVDHASNGLSVVAERFRGERLAGHVALTKGERSELAELAADRL